MAVWYCGSAQWTAITAWAATTAYVIGDIRRQLAAPAAGSARAFRCTTAGTSGGAEPAWNLGSGATTNDGTCVWTEVTGVSTYGWNAAGQNLALFIGSGGRVAAGDTVYVASTHNYSQAGNIAYTNSAPTSNSPVSVICVNPAGSVPPVAADVTTGATETTTGNTVTFGCVGFFQGLKAVGGASTTAISITASGRFVNCHLQCSANNANTTISLSGNPAVVWENMQLSFANAGGCITPVACSLTWRNSLTPFPATVPTVLFDGALASSNVVVEGVDLSAVSSQLVNVPAAGTACSFSFVNCDLHASVVLSPAIAAYGCYVSNIISDSGATNYRRERQGLACLLTTETTLVAGARAANDGVTSFSYKLVSTANLKYAFPFECFPISKWNDTTGSAVTCSVALLNDGTTLTDMDVWMDVEVLDDAGEPIAGLHTSGTGNPLSAGSNIATDAGAPWVTTGMGSPVQQLMSVTFTPQMKGYIRAYVRFARASKTIYVNPVLELS